MMLRARSIARASTVKIELSIRRAFLRIVLFKTATHCFIVVFGAIRKGGRDSVGEYCKISLDNCCGEF